MFTRPHRVTFILYSLDLLHKVTHIFWVLTCFVALPSYTALVSTFCTSSQNFDTHFLHFHLLMDSLWFSMWLAICTSTTDFHRLVKRHACRTKRRRNSEISKFSPSICVWKQIRIVLQWSVLLNIKRGTKTSAEIVEIRIVAKAIGDRINVTIIAEKATTDNTT